MLKILKDTLNNIGIFDLENYELWVDSSYYVKAIIIQDGSINIITNNADVKVNDKLDIEKEEI